MVWSTAQYSTRWMKFNFIPQLRTIIINQSIKNEEEELFIYCYLLIQFNPIHDLTQERTNYTSLVFRFSIIYFRQHNKTNNDDRI